MYYDVLRVIEFEVIFNRFFFFWTIVARNLGFWFLTCKTSRENVQKHAENINRFRRIYNLSIAMLVSKSSMGKIHRIATDQFTEFDNFEYTSNVPWIILK